MNSEIINDTSMCGFENGEHPDIPDEMIHEWQGMVNIMANTINVPAGLIMHIEGDKISVLVRSETEGNPYKIGDSETWFGSGLYCESVILSGKSLFISNALEDKQWSNNPDVKLNMINYQGFPIKWPNGDPFGTICVLDSKTHHYTMEHEKLMLKFSKIIETKLSLLEQNKQLNHKLSNVQALANTDSLTNILNRRAFFEQCDREINRAKRYGNFLCLLLLDLDKFKNINDKFGHNIGDEILSLFANKVQQMKRLVDVFGRIGGEEFAILLPETNVADAMVFADRIREHTFNITVPVKDEIASVTVSVGIAEYNNFDLEFKEILSQADVALYKAKRSGRNIVCQYLLN